MPRRVGGQEVSSDVSRLGHPTALETHMSRRDVAPYRCANGSAWQTAEAAVPPVRSSHGDRASTAHYPCAD